MKLSSSEKLFLIDGVEQNLRLDGRQRLDFREFSVETGIVFNANGSARVKLGKSDVLVGVKLEIGKPEVSSPSCGKIELNVEMTPGLELSKNFCLKSTFSEVLLKAIDLEKLCIVPGEYCWVAYIDCLVLDSSGNLVDTLGLCIKSALMNTRIPLMEITKTEGITEVGVKEGQNEMKMFPGARKVPICVTFGIFEKQLFVLDPAFEEEACVGTEISIGVTEEGKVFSVHKRQFWGMNPGFLIQIMEMGKTIGKKVMENLLKVLSEIEDEKKTQFFAK